MDPFFKHHAGEGALSRSRGDIQISHEPPIRWRDCFSIVQRPRGQPKLLSMKCGISYLRIFVTFRAVWEQSHIVEQGVRRSRASSFVAVSSLHYGILARKRQDLSI